MQYFSIPISEASRPADGDVYVYVDRYWETENGKSIIFYGNPKRLDYTVSREPEFFPQCNPNKTTAEFLAARRGHEIISVNVVFISSCLRFVKGQLKNTP